MQKLWELSKRAMRRVGNFIRRRWDDAVIDLDNLFSSKSSHRIIILDDVFPHPLSAFRIVEYNFYIKEFFDVVIYSDALSFSALSETRSFEEVLKEYEDLYPHFSGKVFKFHPNRRLRAELAYTMFLHNAFKFVDIFERYDLPFVLTLYPGGGFRLDQPESDKQLARVCSSPKLKKVIVTQKIIYDYLVDKKFLDSSRVELIYGGVFPAHHAKGANIKAQFPEERSSFNICFVAHKYMKQGLDKGYDIFIDVANRLACVHHDILFHVVGPFDESDFDVSQIRQKIVFHGVQQADFFSSFYREMDIILSPNVPFVLYPGAFDGFPTGCCMEAGLCGVAVFCTDELRQNVAFEDGQDIVIIPRDVEQICALVNKYYRNPVALYELAQKGQQAFRKEFDVEAQMAPRLRILSEAMSASRKAN